MPFRPTALCLLPTFLVAGFSIAAENPAFPLKVSANHRYLVDQKDHPFFYHADTAWMLFLKLTAPEAAEYLAARKAQGFNVIQVQLTGFLGATTRADELPFAPPGYDFAEPNEAFFAHVDKVVAEAERQGLVLAMTPAWSGCCAEGWAGQTKDQQPAPLNTNGPEKSRALGKWIGTRYAKFSNVMWIMGGDNDPDNAREPIRQLALGLQGAAPAQLMTYHASSTHSSTDVWPAEEPWLGVSMVYTYFRGFNKAWKRDQPDVWEVSHAEFAKAPTRPFFLGESTYEGEHGDWGSALQARKQAWWCVLGGGCGHAYGSPNWNFPANWREVLKLPGAASLRHVRTLLEARAWWTLVPDVKDEIVVAGHGARRQNDAAIAALTADSRCLLAYLPGPRTLTVDLAKLTGTPLVASWFNPRTGESEKIAAFTEKQRTEFTPGGEGDWVLVIEAAATP